ncbi:Hypothetical protein SCF082_LOCUS25855, partial [Durusdinium trenchii]
GRYWDGVPSAWKLHIEVPDEGFADLKTPSERWRGSNHKRYLRPVKECSEGTPSDVILRCLDAGRHGSMSLTGFGKLEAAWPWDTDQQPCTEHDLSAPKHIYRELQALIGSKQVLRAVFQSPSNTFGVRRIMQLCAEKEMVYDPSLPRRSSSREEGNETRGHFPYIDERVSMLDEVTLDKILRIRHKTNSRRHPKWQEIQYWIKRWHRFYLRRRAVKRAEERGTEAQLKKALASS